MAQKVFGQLSHIKKMNEYIKISVKTPISGTWWDFGFDMGLSKYIGTVDWFGFHCNSKRYTD